MVGIDWKRGNQNFLSSLLFEGRFLSWLEGEWRGMDWKIGEWKVSVVGHRSECTP